MSGVNKVILVGNCGQDPEIRYMPNGNAVANVTIATSEKWKDQAGQQQERTEWHRVVFFNKIAEVVGQYVRKGSKLYIEGKLRTRKWQDQSGQDRYTTEIVVDVGGTMQMLDTRAEGGSNDNRGQQQQAPQPNNQQRQPNPNYNDNGQAKTPQQMQETPTQQQPSQNQQPEDEWDDIPF